VIAWRRHFFRPTATNMKINLVECRFDRHPISYLYNSNGREIYDAAARRLHPRCPRFAG